MKAFRFLAGSLPLLGAIFVTLQGPGLNPSYPYQALVVALIVTGITGTIFAVSIVDRFTLAMNRLDEALESGL
jgi:ABC-type uncharacterized transport system permease subunit